MNHNEKGSMWSDEKIFCLRPVVLNCGSQPLWGLTNRLMCPISDTLHVRYFTLWFMTLAKKNYERTKKIILWLQVTITWQTVIILKLPLGRLRGTVFDSGHLKLINFFNWFSPELSCSNKLSPILLAYEM